MSDYQMFTDAGNAAVDEIVRKVLKQERDRNTAYGWIYAELEKLETVEVFAEATDTAVREAVWDAVCAALPEAVFSSVRA